MWYVFIMVILSIVSLFFGILIGSQREDPIGTLTLNRGGADRPPFELRIFKDPKEMKSGTIVTFELIVK